MLEVLGRPGGEYVVRGEHVVVRGNPIEGEVSCAAGRTPGAGPYGPGAAVAVGDGHLNLDQVLGAATGVLDVQRDGLGRAARGQGTTGNRVHADLPRGGRPDGGGPAAVTGGGPVGEGGGGGDPDGGDDGDGGEVSWKPSWECSSSFQCVDGSRPDTWSAGDWRWHRLDQAPGSPPALAGCSRDSVSPVVCRRAAPTSDPHSEASGP